jgi:cell division protease FtsH
MDDTALNALINRISRKQERLRNASLELKEHFVGLDHVIDKILSSIEAWFCMPELLTRPTIVNLWGLTGIGKTDLVRRLVKALDFTDNFVEIQMTNKGSSSNTYSTTLQGLLAGSNITAEETGILLLDEIQRFRSVDQEGKEIHDYVFQDLWMLLSDGSFGSASDNKQQIMDMVLEAIYWEDFHKAQKEAAEAAKKKAKEQGKDDDDDDEEDAAAEQAKKDAESRRTFKQTYWQARQLKKKLHLTESVEEIMKWGSERKLQVLHEKLNDKSIFRPEVYSKLLIFVSGNLDEAYSMANQTEETDVEADLFHKHSLRINLIGIKNALKARFKPEQIARFGNTHVIYPALNRESYEVIIRRKMDAVLKDVTKASGLTIKCDRTVYDAIYRNGVFPVQGTRPVFSTISSFFESNLPTFTLKALQKGVKEIELYYDKKNLCSMIGDTLIKVKNEGDIDKIKRDKRNENLIRKVAVHETGHAIAYAAMFNYIPTQVAVLVASEDKNGFIGMHAIDSNKTFLERQIQVFLAGRIAEEIVFGESLIGAGASGDLDKAWSSRRSSTRSR